MTTPKPLSAFSDSINNLKEHGNPNLPAPFRIQIPNARKVLAHFLGSYLRSVGITSGKWIPEYDEVAAWLTDNKGKGLLLHGTCGRGKSILTRFVIPAILNQYYRKVVSVYDIQRMNEELDDALTKRFIALDDIGTEELRIKYGERRMPFAEIMDIAEKRGNLVIISTNLSGAEFKERYGDRILDRIKSITVRVPFDGPSFRK